MKRLSIATRPVLTKRRGVALRQGGMTLIELMIGLLIGLVITGAATAIFLAANRMGKSHDDSGKLLEDGTFAVNRMAAVVKRGGYVDLLAGNDVLMQVLDNSTLLGQALYQPTTIAFDKLGALYASVIGHPAGIFGCNNGVFNAAGDCSAQGSQDALMVAYQAVASASAPDPFSPSVPSVASDGSAFSDCNGHAPPAGTDVVINRYYVNAQGQLMCLGNGNPSAQILASNVEQFRVSYGLSNWALPTDKTRRVAWQTATQVAAVNRWNAVIQVEICLILAGPPGSAPNPAIINNCDGTSATTSDTRMRKTFRSTVTLRNAPLSS